MLVGLRKVTLELRDRDDFDDDIIGFDKDDAQAVLRAALQPLIRLRYLRLERANISSPVPWLQRLQRLTCLQLYLVRFSLEQLEALHMLRLVRLELDSCDANSSEIVALVQRWAAMHAEHNGCVLGVLDLAGVQLASVVEVEATVAAVERTGVWRLQLGIGAALDHIDQARAHALVRDFHAAQAGRCAATPLD